MRDLNIVNHTKNYIPRREMLKILTTAAEYFKFKNFSFSVIITTPGKIKKLNRLYRKKNVPTDVLSFSYFCDSDNLDAEVVICYSIAAKQAKELNHSVTQEIKHLLIHGLIHTLGYDHQEKAEARAMQEQEKKLFKLINLRA